MPTAQVERILKTNTAKAYHRVFEGHPQAQFDSTDL